MKEKLKTTKALITFDSKTLEQLDKYAKLHFMGNRSQAANFIVGRALSEGYLLKYLVNPDLTKKEKKVNE